MENMNFKMLLILNRIMTSKKTLIDFDDDILRSDFEELDEAGMLNQLILHESAFNNNLIVDLYDVNVKFIPHTVQLVEDYIRKNNSLKNVKMSYENLLIMLWEENRIHELFPKD